MQKQESNKHFIIAIILLEGIAFLSNDIYIPALPYVSYDLGVQEKFSQYTFSLWMLGGGLFELITGYLISRISYKFLLMFMSSTYILSSFLCGISPDIFVLIFARFIQGGCVSSILVISYSMVFSLFDTKESIRVGSQITSVSVLIPAIAPLMGGALLYFISWRGIFFLLCTLGVIMLICSQEVVRKSKNIEKISDIVNLKNTLLDYFMVLKNRKLLMFMLIHSLSIFPIILWISEGVFIVKKSYDSKILYGLIQLFIVAGFSLGSYCVSKFVKKCDPIKIIKFSAISGLIASIISIPIAYLSFEISLIAFACVVFFSSLAVASSFRFATDSSDVSAGIKVSVTHFLSSTLSCVFVSISSQIENKTMAVFSVIVLIAGVVRFVLCNFAKAPNIVVMTPAND